jgi:hypothetical protein
MRKLTLSLVALLVSITIQSHERFDPHFDEVLDLSQARAIRISFPRMITGQYLINAGLLDLLCEVEEQDATTKKMKMAIT